MRVAVIGLGEAGSTYARGLRDRGADVIGYDRAFELDDVGCAPDAVSAARGADLVLSLVCAANAADVADEVADVCQGAVFADMNTGSRELKQHVTSRMARAGVPCADVAIMAPILRHGIMTQLLTSGPGAAEVSRLFTALEVPISVVGTQPGDAASLKLTRSVFLKGLGSLVFESLRAAEALGAHDWMLEQMAGEFGPEGETLVERLITGTRLHAVRRSHEMKDVREYLRSIDVPAEMTEGTIAWLDRIVAGDDRVS
ncbi:NAD(P)-dependent oxidoreductase [Microbacterium sediminicola]|uniref:NAD(P)-dependent oxidoreductase n=1 Tax=Microbacterium sediminicola TaxID=415210 RepID=A0ABP4TID9_9MICO